MNINAVKSKPQNGKRYLKHLENICNNNRKPGNSIEKHGI